MTFVVQDFAPVLEALVRGQHGRGAAAAGVDQLEEQPGALWGAREIAALVHDQQGRVCQRPEALLEPTRAAWASSRASMRSVSVPK